MGAGEQMLLPRKDNACFLENIHKINVFMFQKQASLHTLNKL